MNLQQIKTEAESKFKESFSLIDDGSGNQIHYNNEVLSFLDTLIDKVALQVREEIRGKVEKLMKYSDEYVPYQKIHYQSALSDVLAALDTTGTAN